MSHSWLSPSGFAPILDDDGKDFLPGCVGKPFMEKDIPEKGAGEAAERGTRIHAFAEKILKGARIEITDDTASEFDVALGYTTYINDIVEEEGDSFELRVEEKLDVFPEIFITGTGDCFKWFPKGILHLIDLKTGRIPVTPVRNPQLMAYAESFLRAYPHLVCLKVVFHIYQPGNESDPWECSRESLSVLIGQIEKHCNTAYEIYTGTKELHYDRHLFVNPYCEYCRALSNCPKAKDHIRKSSLVLLDESEPQIPPVHSLTHGQKVNIQRVAPLLIKYVAEVEESLRVDIEAGVDSPLEIVAGKSRRTWNDDFDVARTLTSLGVEPWRKDLITITEAEKKLGKKKALIPEEAFTVVNNRSKLVFKNRENHIGELLDD